MMLRKPAKEIKETTTEGSVIENSCIKELLQSQFSKSRIKINDNAINMMTELAKLLVVESANRAVLLAKEDRKAENQIKLDHIEAALPQLMLDLP